MSVLNESDLVSVVDECWSFLHTLAEVYGSERAQDAWVRIGESLGHDVKDAVFLAMLSGESGSTRVTFRITDQNLSNRVSAIRAIREAAPMSLKEAKDLTDAAMVRATVVSCGSRQAAKGLRQALRDLGMEAR
jgi:ribosomal protein L7/L12